MHLENAIQKRHDDLLIVRSFFGWLFACSVYSFNIYICSLRMCACISRVHWFIDSLIVLLKWKYALGVFPLPRQRKWKIERTKPKAVQNTHTHQIPKNAMNIEQRLNLFSHANRHPHHSLFDIPYRAVPYHAFHWIGMWICISKYKIIINTVYLFFYCILCCLYRRFSRIKYA